MKTTILNSQGVPLSLVTDEQIYRNEMALAQFNPFGFPAASAFPGQQQLSNTDTLWKNLRWYLVSNFRQMLSQCYVEIGLIKTIVDVPVEDGYRGGVTIKTKQLDDEQIEELEAYLEEKEDFATAAQADKWNRLFGGGGILVLSDQDPEEPLDINTLKDQNVEFRAVDMWELFWDLQNTMEGNGPELDVRNVEFFSYYGEKVHKSRVLLLKGMQAPSFIRPRLRGWGFSVVEILVRSINQYLKGTDVGFEVFDEFKVDVYKLKNLASTLLMKDGGAKVQQRIQIANQAKNFQHAIALDAEDDYDHKQVSWAGLADAMTGVRMQVACDLRMPLTKVFGISAAGFNSGEDDIENYNAMVESEVRAKAKKNLIKMIKVRCLEKFGLIPDDLKISFKSLRILSSTDEETVKTQKHQRLLGARQAGEITTIEYRDGCNRGGLLDITLDTEQDDLNPEDPLIEDLLSGATQEAEQEAAAAGQVPGGKPGSGAGPGKKDPNAAPAASNKPKKPVTNSLLRFLDIFRNAWEEAKHPRAEDGKFGEGSGEAGEGDLDEKKKIETLDLSLPGFTEAEENKLLEKIKSAETKEDVEKLLVELLAQRDKLRKEGKSVGDLGKVISLARERYAEIHEGKKPEPKEEPKPGHKEEPKEKPVEPHYTKEVFFEQARKIDHATDIPTIEAVLKDAIQKAQFDSRGGYNAEAWERCAKIQKFAKDRIEQLKEVERQRKDEPKEGAETWSKEQQVGMEDQIGRTSDPELLKHYIADLGRRTFRVRGNIEDYNRVIETQRKAVARLEKLGGAHAPPKDPLKPEPEYRYTPEREKYDKQYLDENCNDEKSTRKFIKYLDEYFKAKPTYSDTPRARKQVLAGQIMRTARVRQRAFYKLRQQMKNPELPKTVPFSPEKTLRANLDAALKCYQAPGFDVAFKAPPGSRFKSGTMACVCYGRIYINEGNKEYWGDVVKRQKEIHGKSWLSSSDPYHTIHHEIGHVLYEPPWTWQDRKHKALVMGQVSEYSGKNPKEFVSEVHAGIKVGVKFSEEIMKLFHEYARPNANFSNAYDEEDGLEQIELYDPTQEETIERDADGNILVGEEELLNPGAKVEPQIEEAE